jgi:hypothetical protein
MSNLNFPTNPTIGDLWTVGTKTYRWTGQAWVVYVTNIFTSTNVSSSLTFVTSTTNSISTTTGALTVAGGVGIGGDLYVGGTIYGNIAGASSTSTSLEVVETTSAFTHYVTFVDSNNTTTEAELFYTTSSLSLNPSEGEVYIRSRLGINTVSSTATLAIDGKMVVGDRINAENVGNILNYAATSGTTAYRSFNLIDSSAGIKIARLSSTDTHAVIELQHWDTTASTLYSYFDLYTGPAQGEFSIRDRKTAGSPARITISSTGTVNILSTNTSVSTNTGALVVTGGVGIGGDVWAEGRVSAESVKILDAVFDSTKLILTPLDGNGDQVIDTYSLDEYRAAKYFIQISKGTGTSSTFQAQEITLIASNTSTVDISVYGKVTTNGPTGLGTFTAAVISTTTVNLIFTPDYADDYVIKVLRTAMTS